MISELLLLQLAVIQYRSNRTDNMVDYRPSTSKETSKDVGESTDKGNRRRTISENSKMNHKSRLELLKSVCPVIQLKKYRSHNKKEEIVLNGDVLIILMKHLSLNTLLTGVGRVCFQWYLARNFVLSTKRYLCLSSIEESLCDDISSDGLCMSSFIHRFFGWKHEEMFDPKFMINKIALPEKKSSGTGSWLRRWRSGERPNLVDVLLDQLPGIERLTVCMYDISSDDLLRLLTAWQFQMTELRLVLKNDKDQIRTTEWEQIFSVIARMPKLVHLSLLVRNNQLDELTQLQSIDFNLLIPAVRRLEEFYLGLDGYNNENRRTVFNDVLRALDLTKLKHWGMGFFNYNEQFYTPPIYWSVADIVTHTVETQERRNPELLNRMDRFKIYYRPWQFNRTHMNTDSFPEFGQFSDKYESMSFLEISLFCSRIEHRFIATLAKFTHLETLVLNYHYQVSGDEKFVLYPCSSVLNFDTLPSVKRLYVQRVLAHSPLLRDIFTQAEIIPY